MRKFLNNNNNIIFNILKITVIILCLSMLRFHNQYINIGILIFTVLLFLNHNKYPFRILSTGKPNLPDSIAKSPGLIAFFSTLLSLFKTDQNIIGDFKQAIIMGILIHLATLPSNNNHHNNGDINKHQ